MFKALRRSAAMGVVMGTVLALGMSGTSAAYYTTATGAYGYWGLVDNSGDPGVKCGYSAPDAHGVAVVKWLKILHVTQAWALDTSPGVDHQKISWRLQIQRWRPGGSWVTVAKSSLVTKTAYDNAPANYGTVKVYWTSNKAYDERYRARVVMKWLRNGNVQGKVTLTIAYYGVSWTVGDPSAIYADYCLGHAD